MISLHISVMNIINKLLLSKFWPDTMYLPDILAELAFWNPLINLSCIEPLDRLITLFICDTIILMQLEEVS